MSSFFSELFRRTSDYFVYKFSTDLKPIMSIFYSSFQVKIKVFPITEFHNFFNLLLPKISHFLQFPFVLTISGKNTKTSRNFRGRLKPFAQLVIKLDFPNKFSRISCRLKFSAHFTSIKSFSFEVL